MTGTRPSSVNNSLTLSSSNSLLTSSPLLFDGLRIRTYFTLSMILNASSKSSPPLLSLAWPPGRLRPNTRPGVIRSVPLVLSFATRKTRRGFTTSSRTKLPRRILLNPLPPSPLHHPSSSGHLLWLPQLPPLLPPTSKTPDQEPRDLNHHYLPEAEETGQ